MLVGEICTREVIVCNVATSLLEVARLMREHHVGTVVVVLERNGKRLPIGVITDRDLVIEVLALDIPPRTLTAADIKTAELVTVGESQDAFEALELMRQKGIRRVPVVDTQGTLIGVVAMDDLLEVVAEELNLMAKLISREQLRERVRRPARATETEAPPPAH